MNLLRPILLGGLVAGFLDGADALVFTKLALGLSPGRLLQYIASGLLGPPAFRGGWHTVALGVCIHFSIAIVAASVFCIASTRIGVLTETPLLSGTAFGLVVYAVMHYVVLPLSALPKRTIPVTRLEVANLLFSHIFFVGMPIALAARNAKVS